jgi:hypothetical protein
MEAQKNTNGQHIYGKILNFNSHQESTNQNGNEISSQLR